MLKLRIYLNSRNQSREFGNFETLFKFSQLFSRKPEREWSIFRGLKNRNEKVTGTVFYGYFEKCGKLTGKLMCLVHTTFFTPLHLSILYIRMQTVLQKNKLDSFEINFKRNGGDGFWYGRVWLTYPNKKWN